MPRITEVVAVESGHDGKHFRHAGSRFHVDLEDPRFKGSSWFVKAGNEPAPKPKATSDVPPGAGPKPGSAPPDEASAAE